MPPPKKTTAPGTSRKKQDVSRAAPATLVLRQFRVVFNAVKTHFRLVEKKAGVSGAQLWALSVIKWNPGIGMNALALEMDVHQSTASNLVKALVARDMIAATKGNVDRRSVALKITRSGEKVLRHAPQPFTGMLPDALASLDAKTLARLEKDLNKLIEALDVDEHAANVPLADL